MFVKIYKIYFKLSQYKKLWLSASVILAVFFLYLSTRSIYQLKEGGYPEISSLFDAMNHFIGFGIFSITLRLYLERRKDYRKTMNRTSLLVIIIVCLWGITCESIQFLVPTRGVELIDYVANTLPAPLTQLAINSILKSVYESI